MISHNSGRPRTAATMRVMISRFEFMSPSAAIQSGHQMLRPEFKELRDPAKPRFEFRDRPFRTAVTQTAAALFDIDRRGASSQQKLHHARVNHIIREALVGTLHAKLLAELRGFKIDVVEPHHPRDLVEES